MQEAGRKLEVTRKSMFLLCYKSGVCPFLAVSGGNISSQSNLYNSIFNSRLTNLKFHSKNQNSLFTLLLFAPISIFFLKISTKNTCKLFVTMISKDNRVTKRYTGVAMKPKMKCVMLRMTEEDYELVKECAWIERITVSGWIRNLVVGTAISKGVKK